MSHDARHYWTNEERLTAIVAGIAVAAVIVLVLGGLERLRDRLLGW
jgi:hypothetical protein